MKLTQTRLLSSFIVGSACVFGATLYAQDCPPEQLLKLIASDGSDLDEFGNAVALDGSFLLIGADHYDGPFDNSGKAYLHDLTTGDELYTLEPSTTNLENRFGGGVAIEGNYILIGAAFNTNDNGTYAGAAYLFDVATGLETNLFMPEDGQGDDNFGSLVRIDGNIALIGALGDDDMGVDSGSAYLYDLSTGNELFKLTASDGAASHRFGSSGDIENGYAIVGAWQANGGTGAAYVYDVATGTQLHILVPDDGNSGDRFGSGGTIAIEGDFALVGSPSNGGFKGSAYVFDLFTGQQIMKLRGSSVPSFGQFGAAIDWDGDLALISVQSDNVNGSTSGSAYLFDMTTGTEIVKLLPDDGAASDNFGWFVAMQGTIGFIGSVFDDNANGSSAGAAYAFDLAPTGCNATLTVSPEPLIAGQDGTFTVTEANPGENTYLAYSLHGIGSTFVPMLNITLDLNNPKQAGNTQLTNGAGSVEWVLAIPGAAAGRDLWFQAAQFELKSNVIATSVQ